VGRDRLWCGGYTDAIAAAVTRDLCLVLVLGSLELISLYACFRPGLISHGTVFFSHNKPASAGLISLEINQRTG